MTPVRLQLGEINLVRWQGRRNRRLKSGGSAWTVISAACAIVGAAMLLAQGLGVLPLTGASALAPAGIVLFALCTQVVTVARAVVAWITG